MAPAAPWLSETRSLADWRDSVVPGDTSRFKARWVRDDMTTSRSRAGATIKDYTSDNVFDAYGFVVYANNLGDAGDGADNRCVYTNRAPTLNLRAWILDRAEVVEGWANTCGGVSGVRQSYTSFRYDGHAAGAPVAAGLVTQSRSYDGEPAAGGVEHITNNSYDSYGRLAASADPNGNNTDTIYAPTTGYPTVVTVKNMALQTTTTTIDPRWGVPLVATDANGKITTRSYDAMGRLWKVWQPTEPTTGLPSFQYGYQLDQSPLPPTPVSNSRLSPKVCSYQLQDAAGPTWLTSCSLTDGLGRIRETHTYSPTTNKSVSMETRYNDHGQAAAAAEPAAYVGAPEDPL